MLVRFLAIVAMALPASVAAQAINKCKHPQTGEVAYTSMPCPTTQQDWNRQFEGTGSVYDRDQMSRAEAQARIDRHRQDLGSSRSQYQAPRYAGEGAVIPLQGGTRCEEAKLLRDREIYKLGPKVTIEVRDRKSVV